MKKLVLSAACAVLAISATACASNDYMPLDPQAQVPPPKGEQ